MGSIFRTSRHNGDRAVNTALRFSVIGMVVAAPIGGLLIQRVGIIELRAQLATARLKNEALRKSDSGPVPQALQMPANLKPRHPGLATASLDDGRRIAVDESPWKDKGNASPESALETAMSAASRGDVDALARLLVFEAKAREIAQSLRANLPDSSRAEFPTDESLIALLLARQAPLEGIEVIGRFEVPDGGVLLRVAMAGPSGSSKHADFAFVQGPDGWRFVVTSELASHAAHLLKR